MLAEKREKMHALVSSILRSREEAMCLLKLARRILLMYPERAIVRMQADVMREASLEFMEQADESTAFILKKVFSPPPRK